MTQLQAPDPSRNATRRALLKTAAWATPVVTIAVAAPFAAASINDAGVQLEQTVTNSASRPRVDGGANVTSEITRPSILRITNGNGAVPGPITGVMTLTYVSSTFSVFSFGNVDLRGFAPASIVGANMGVYSMTGQPDIGSSTFGRIRARNTSRAFTLTAAQIAGNTNQALAITWGTTAGYNGSALFNAGTVTYTVTVKLFSNGVEFASDTDTLVVTY